MSKTAILESVRETIIEANNAEVLIREALQCHLRGQAPTDEWAKMARRWLAPHRTRTDVKGG